MSELTHGEEYVLNGDSYDVDELFGDWVKTAGSELFLPRASRQVQGECREGWMDILEAVARGLSCASGIYVYRDSTDDEDEFSVKAGPVAHQGRWMDYAGEVNLGPLSRGAVNYVWLDVSGAAPSAEFGAAWPDPSPNVIRLATIAMPASGYWRGVIGGDLARLSGGQGLSPMLASPGVLKATIVHDSPGTVVIGRVAAGCAIGCRRATVPEDFNGSSPTVTVGDVEDTERLLNVGDTLLAVGIGDAFFVTDKCTRYEVETEIIATYVADGSTEGEVVFYLEVLP
jgi:hypothetical protein